MHNMIDTGLMPPLQLEAVFALRLVLACICGACVGYERSKRQKEAGLRTHIIVTLGSCLATIVSKYGFFDVVINESMQVDVSRISSNLLPSIAFLGAGMIFTRHGGIKGLTTAAGIWATASVGLAIGSGLYLLGIIATILVVIIHVVFHHIYDSGAIATLHLRYDKTETVPDNITEQIEQNFHCRVKRLDAKRNPSGSIHIQLEIHTIGKGKFEDISLSLLKDPHFLEIEM